MADGSVDEVTKSPHWKPSVREATALFIWGGGGGGGAQWPLRGEERGFS